MASVLESDFAGILFVGEDYERQMDFYGLIVGNLLDLIGFFGQINYLLISGVKIFI